MNKKKITEIVIVCVLFLVLAGYVEATEHNIDNQNRVIRASPGGHAQNLELELDAEDILVPFSAEKGTGKDELLALLNAACEE